MSIVKSMTGTMAASVFLSAVVAAHAAERATVPPHGYYVAEFEITDPEGMKPYSANVESTFKLYGGHFICPLKSGGDATEPHCSSALAAADAVDHSCQPISAR